MSNTATTYISKLNQAPEAPLPQPSPPPEPSPPLRCDGFKFQSIIYSASVGFGAGLLLGIWLQSARHAAQSASQPGAIETQDGSYAQRERHGAPSAYPPTAVGMPDGADAQSSPSNAQPLED
ncbi:hypothetical protein C8F01DRAFT_1257178 [Mycena amicta]|nr:hypothetical protein C8F01DRAFT_1257178 [Mycena amicta]